MDKRFAIVEKLATDVAERLREFDNTEIALKRAETSFNELVEKINRRVNELGEIQRLGDQRFRQEWSTFQADAQKRWSSFTLSHEEQQRETARQREKLADQVVQLEDNLREMQDSLQHLGDQSERNMQTILEMARDSLAEHERFVSNSR
jgi:truncated hemoglobin YjbI